MVGMSQHHNLTLNLILNLILSLIWTLFQNSSLMKNLEGMEEQQK